MKKSFSIKNLFNGDKNKKEFKTSKEKMEIINSIQSQETRKVVIKRPQNNNGFPSDFGGSGILF